ncbi:hypothetical protein LTR86_007509 [Recurvomyces mirabilis]|nr:hypothetical protein LTR86_007509 [Recurvomyces mirabilis]
MSTSILLFLSFAFLAAAQSSITTTNTASASPIPSGPSCPGSDGTVYTPSPGSYFVIECGVDHAGGDMGSQSAHNLTACIQGCDSTPGCVDVSLSGSACYLKKTLGAAKSQAGIYGARRIADPSATGAATSSTSSVSSASPSPTGPSCPASNNTLLTASSGAQFVIECGIDHAAGNMGQATIAPGSISQCLQICDSTSGCVDVSVLGAGCYLKSSVGAVSYNAQVNGARLVVASPNASSVSTSSSSSTTSSTATTLSTSPTTSVLGCPQSNGTVFTANSGYGYFIE